MNTAVEKLKEANFQASLKLMISLDEKIVRLRESYKANQTNIKEAESKLTLASEFENLQNRGAEITLAIAHNRGKLESYQMFEGEICKISGSVSKKATELKKSIAIQCSELTTQNEILEAEQKQSSVLLRSSHNAVELSAMLGTLRNREQEIKEEGTRLKVEKENLYNDIEKLRLSNFSFNPKNQINIIKEEIICNVGSRCLRLAEFLFSSKTCKEVFYPNIGDWREDYMNALRSGKIFRAVFISVKIYLNFVYTMILCSKAGKLIEFIMKLADIIEFFNKFSK